MSANATIAGVAAALPLPNVDTDTIIPIDYCINRERPHFDVALFRRWRFDADGHETPGFVLNRPALRTARILVTGTNFGCGSSREMAVWALADFGIRAVVGPGFGEIFYNNCFQNGVLAAVISPAAATRLGTCVAEREGMELVIDVDARTITGAGVDAIPFALDALRAEMLVNGLDPIAATLTREDAITAFERRDRAARPWAQGVTCPDPDPQPG